MQVLVKLCISFFFSVKDKADVLKQVEDLNSVKDELTAEVSGWEAIDIVNDIWKGFSSCYKKDELPRK